MQLWGDSGHAGDGDVCDSDDGNSPKQHNGHWATDNSEGGGANPATSSTANQQGEWQWRRPSQGAWPYETECKPIWVDQEQSDGDGVTRSDWSCQPT